MIKVAWYTVVVLITLVVLILLWQFRMALVIFLLSLAVAAAFRPVIEYLKQRRVHRGVALILPYLIAISLFVGLFFAISGPFIQDIQQAIDNLTVSYERAISRWPQTGTLFQRTIAEQLPALEDLINTLMSEQGLIIVQTFLGIAFNFFDIISRILIILILSMYWSADNIRFERLLLSLIPAEKRANARDTWREIEIGVGNYLRSAAIQSLLAGVFLYLGYTLMGLDYAALLSLSGAVAWLIPWLGAVLVVIPALLVGLGSSTALGITAALFTLIVLLFLEVIIEPRLFPRWRYSSLLLVLVVIALADIAGLVGVILAPPLAAAIQIFFNRIAKKMTTETEPASTPAHATVELHERLAKVQLALTGEEDPPPPEIRNLIDRLSQLVQKTDHYLRAKSGS